MFCRFDSTQIESIMAPVVSIDKISIEWWQAHVKLKLVSATRFQISLFRFLCSKPYFHAKYRRFLSPPRVQELLLSVGSGLRPECNVNWSGPLKVAFYRTNRSKRNETNQNSLPSIRFKSYRNETCRIEKNRIEIGFCRFDIIEEILWSIRLLSIRFVSIDSRRSIQPSLDDGFL